MAFCTRILLPALALAGLLAACANKVQMPPGTVFEVQSSRAPFYKYGPAQTFGADEALPQGTRVTLVQREMGFSRVMLANGVTGYVSTDDLAVVAPEPKATPSPRVVTNRKLPRLFSAPVKRSNVQPTPGEPLFDINDVPLPMSDTPPKPANGEGTKAE